MLTPWPANERTLVIAVQMRNRFLPTSETVSVNAFHLQTSTLEVINIQTRFTEKALKSFLHLQTKFGVAFPMSQIWIRPKNTRDLDPSRDFRKQDLHEERTR